MQFWPIFNTPYLLLFWGTILALSWHWSMYWRGWSWRGSGWLWLSQLLIFLAGLVSLTTTCLSRQLTAPTGFRWTSASKHLSFILYCPWHSGLPSPQPPRIFSIIRNLEAISKLARFRHGEQRHLCSLLHTADPNKLKPSDLLTHAIIFTFSLILHSPQNNWYPSPACWAPNCSVLSYLTASGSVWQELLAE